MHKLVKVDHIGPFWNLSPDEQAALDTACADLATAGITIEHRPIPWFDEAISLKIYGGLFVTLLCWPQDIRSTKRRGWQAG